MQFSHVLLQAIAASAAAIVPREETRLDKREDWTGDGNVEIYVSDARKFSEHTNQYSLT